MAKKASPITKTAWLDKHGLSDRQRAFVLAYLKTRIALQAAKEAGYAHPDVQGPRLLGNPRIKAAVEEGLPVLEAETQIEAEQVLKRWWSIATADAADLSRIERGACRYCHGIDHQFQWRTQREFEEALFEAAKALSNGNEDMFDAIMAGQIEHPSIPKGDGGTGYRRKAAPHPDCPECEGDGIETVFLADTRTLQDGAAILFDGAKVNAKGQIEVATLDRLKALESAAKHLGMFAGKGEGPAVSDLAAGMAAFMRTTQTVPVVTDDPTKRVKRVTTTTVTTEHEEEP